MSKKRKKSSDRRRGYRAPEEPDIHISFGPIQDDENLVASMVIDAADDREWFRRHPDKVQRSRLASPREQRATGLPAGTIIQVFRRADGSQIRILLEPRADRN